jgi:phage shock protein A
MRRLWNLFGKVVDAVVNALSDRIPSESSLTSDAERMLEALDLRAEAVSFSMARADAKFEELKNELENHEALGRQAEEFLRAGDEEAAERCVALQLQSAKAVERLKKEYEALQREAEQSAQEFLDKRRALEEKIVQIPQLHEDARLIRAQEKIERATAKFSLESAERSFDETAREIRIRKLQLQNRTLLTSDPNAQLDRRIRESLERKEIAEAMAALRKKGFGGPIVDAEFKVIEEDPVASARKLLEAPRYQGILPLAAARSRQEEPADVRRLSRTDERK